MDGIFQRRDFFVIAGPCVLEDDSLNLRVAEAVAKLGSILPGRVVFKASFDKANRSRDGASRGPGLEKGLRALEKIREATGLPLLTDVHLPDQCAAAAQVVDVLQIPAFLCRQTDLLAAAGATGKEVNIKKGQWMTPEAMAGAVEKVRGTRASTQDDSIAVTERGTFFGYGDLVVDMRSIQRIEAACRTPVIFDATHSVQRPGMQSDGSSGGAREFVPLLARAAVAAGAHGVFLETHPDPEHAPSDGANMIVLDQLEALVLQLLRVREAVLS